MSSEQLTMSKKRYGAKNTFAKEFLLTNYELFRES